MCDVQYVWSVTFLPCDGRFWSSACLAGKQGCVPISYCLVGRRECKCRGHTWNKRENMRGEKKMATESRLVGKLVEPEWSLMARENRRTEKERMTVLILTQMLPLWSMEALFITGPTCMCINVEGGGVETPQGLLIITLTKQDVTLLRQIQP